jgi:hypothetical protein
VRLANSGESGPPCGVPFRAGHSPSVALPPRRSLDVPDQPQQAFITHFATYQVHQSVVVHVIEGALQIDVPPPRLPPRTWLCAARTASCAERFGQ